MKQRIASVPVVGLAYGGIGLRGDSLKVALLFFVAVTPRPRRAPSSARVFLFVRLAFPMLWEHPGASMSVCVCVRASVRLSVRSATVPSVHLSVGWSVAGWLSAYIFTPSPPTRSAAPAATAAAAAAAAALPLISGVVSVVGHRAVAERERAQAHRRSSSN